MTMNDTHHPRRIGRSIGALLTGILAGVILSLGTDELGTVGSVATWNRGLGPHWYPLALIALAMPCAWAGGRLRVTQLRGRVDGGGKNAH
jgi:hypothetical protein